MIYTSTYLLRNQSNGVGVRKGQTDFSYCIMWLNLGGVRIPTESEAFNEVLGNVEPVQVWISCLVGVQVSCSTIEFA